MCAYASVHSTRENRNPPRTLSSPRRPRPRRQPPLRRQSSFQTKPPSRQHDLKRLSDGDLERWRQAATTDGSPIWSGLTTAIWSGGSREAEAAATDAAAADAATMEGSSIWNGLAMAIWSCGSRAAEATTEATTEATAEDVQRRRNEGSESTRGVSRKKRRRMGDQTERRSENEELM
ncbi:uncharacterized protein HKW66_Vig0003120 [Vigna angularis]|uniref:Uncharacterized protein n=1 Tax=Phaseolus angularis TaxID=3914 RepID=A0A8T0LC95_PHAAN|nr:uncharacterized protein HKW66_Vig0003120 [Vigna angularis]